MNAQDFKTSSNKASCDTTRVSGHIYEPILSEREYIQKVFFPNILYFWDKHPPTKGCRGVPGYNHDPSLISPLQEYNFIGNLLAELTLFSHSIVFAIQTLVSLNGTLTIWVPITITSYITTFPYKTKMTLAFFWFQTVTMDTALKIYNWKYH